MTIICGSSLSRFFTRLSLILFILSTADAQNDQRFSAHTPLPIILTSTLNGTVVDEQEAVVPNATVVVKGDKQRLIREVQTDLDGKFVISLPAPERYTVSVQHQGFIPAEIEDVTSKS